MTAEIIELGRPGVIKELDRVALDGDPADVLRVESGGDGLVLLVRYLDTRAEGLVIWRPGRAASEAAIG